MGHYVKECLWDYATGKGQVLVGSDFGPDLWIDIEANLNRPNEGWSMYGKWSKLYSWLKDRQKHRIQHSASESREYFSCAARHIFKHLEEER